MIDHSQKAQAYGLIQYLKKFFLRGSARFPVLAAWGSHCPASSDDLDSVLLAHVLGEQADEATVSLHRRNGINILQGRFRVGLYCLTAEGTTPLICLDFDGGDHHDQPLLNPLQEALSALDHATSLGLAAYLEKSGSGYGWHVWIFPAEPISFEKARLLGLGIAPRAAQLKKGGYANAITGTGIEVFPKSWLGRSDSTGAALWLPYWNGAAEGGNLFYKREGDQVVEFIPEFSFTSLTAIDKALEHLPGLAFWKGRPDAQNTSSSGAKGKKKGSEASEGESSLKGVLEGPDVEPVELESSPGKDWRDRVLAVLDLEKFYSPYLTGKQSGRAWLECRDFRSSSGDKNPSAGVSNGEGDLPRGVWHSFVDGLSLSPFDYLVKLSEIVPEIGCKTFGDAARLIAKLTRIPYPRRNESEKTAQIDKRPLITVTGQQLNAISEQAWKAIHLASSSEPVMFRRAGALVTISQEEEEKSPTVSPLQEAGMRGVLARCAQWYRLKGSGEGEKLEACFPPKEVVHDLLTFQDFKIPELSLISSAPICAPDGSICTEPGYNKAGKVWLTKKAQVGLKFPEANKENAVLAAKFLLDDFLADFPFAQRCDRAHALAALLLPAVRPYISGPTPFHDISSPVQRSGKSLLVSTISSVYLGSPVIGQRIPLEEEEIAKTLLAELTLARPIIFLDNGDTKERRLINSGSLEAVLTSELWTGRKLGKIEMIEPVPVRAAWFITGVNLEYGKGLIGRRVRIRIDPRVEDPSKRTGFKHPKILRWARDHRAEILSAVFTIVRYFLSIPLEDRPAVRPLGGYEDWCEVIGGMLAACDVPGFLEHFDDPEEAAVENGADEWEEFFEVWFKEYADFPQAVAKLNDLAAKFGHLEGLRGDKSKHSQTKRLGAGLKKLRGRIFNGKRVTYSQNKHTKNAEYQLEDLSKPRAQDSEEASAPRSSEEYSEESAF